MKKLIAAFCSLSLTLAPLAAGAGEPEPAPAAAAAQPKGSDLPRADKAEQAAQLVEGAPLGNDNVYVHIVEKKPYTNAGRHELVLYPAVAQINAKFTTHFGVAL